MSGLDEEARDGDCCGSALVPSLGQHDLRVCMVERWPLLWAVGCGLWAMGCGLWKSCCRFLAVRKLKAIWWNRGTAVTPEKNYCQLSHLQIDPTCHRHPSYSTLFLSHRRRQYLLLPLVGSWDGGGSRGGLWAGRVLSRRWSQRQMVAA